MSRIDLSWTATTDDDWITITQTDGGVIITASPASSATDELTGYVTFKCLECVDKDDITVTVTRCEYKCTCDNLTIKIE